MEFHEKQSEIQELQDKTEQIMLDTEHVIQSFLGVNPSCYAPQDKIDWTETLLPIDSRPLEDTHVSEMQKITQKTLNLTNASIQNSYLRSSPPLNVFGHSSSAKNTPLPLFDPSYALVDDLLGEVQLSEGTMQEIKELTRTSLQKTADLMHSFKMNFQ